MKSEEYTVEERALADLLKDAFKMLSEEISDEQVSRILTPVRELRKRKTD